MTGDWSEVAPGLWMGGQVGVPSGEHFDAVLTLGYPNDDIHRDGRGRGRVELLQWLIADRDYPQSPPNANGLATCVEWVLTHWQAGERVLVRCQMGLNRSGLVVGKVLTAAGWSPDDAVAAIRAARGPRALFNGNYERLVRGQRPRMYRYGECGAGVLFRDGDRYLLLKRGAHVHQPGTWGLPGGAVTTHGSDLELPWVAAVRETREEIGADISDATPVATHTTRDDDGWFYVTFTVDEAPDVHLDHEHTEYRWVTAAEGAAIGLHYDLADAWATLTAPTAEPMTRMVPADDPVIGWRVFAVNPNAAALVARLQRGEIQAAEMLDEWWRAPWVLLAPYRGSVVVVESSDDMTNVCAHDPPWLRCICGTYAVAEVTDVPEVVKHVRMSMSMLRVINGGIQPSREYVVAPVAMWGVIAADVTWPGAVRAEHSRLAGPLWPTPGVPRQRLDEVAASYGLEARDEEIDGEDSLEVLARWAAGYPTPSASSTMSTSRPICRPAASISPSSSCQSSTPLAYPIAAAAARSVSKEVASFMAMTSN